MLIKDEKHLKQTASYDDISEDIEEREGLSYEMDSDGYSMDTFIRKVVENIKVELENDKIATKKRMTELNLFDRMIKI